MTNCLLALLFVGADVSKSPWLTDLAAATKLAKEQKRPMFVVFRCDH